MATAFLWNGFGSYETNNDGVQGITVKHGGIDFWLPYQKVTAIPDFALRELDQDKSTPDPKLDGIQPLVYQTILVKGTRMADELVRKSNDGSIAYEKMGIITIEGKLTGQTIEAWAGWDSEGRKIYSEVNEREATKAEKDRAALLAKEYKEHIIKEYLDSKRSRMTGGRGRLEPDAMTRGYMHELGVEDIDDVSAHKKNDPNMALILAVLEAAQKMSNPSPEQIQAIAAAVAKEQRKSPRSQGLAEHKEKYDAEHPDPERDNLAFGQQKRT